MYRLLVVLRTAFLAFLVGFALWSTPMDIWGSQVRVVDIEALRRISRVLWIAIAWVAFETAIGWVLWTVRGRRTARERTAAAVAAASATPPRVPPAPPPASPRP